MWHRGFEIEIECVPIARQELQWTKKCEHFKHMMEPHDKYIRERLYMTIINLWPFLSNFNALNGFSFLKKYMGLIRLIWLSWEISFLSYQYLFCGLVPEKGLRMYNYTQIISLCVCVAHCEPLLAIIVKHGVPFSEWSFLYQALLKCLWTR